MEKLFSFVRDYHLRSYDRKGIDWWLFASIVPITVAGLLTMHSFSGEDSIATRQLVWIVFSIIVFFSISFLDLRFLRKSWVSITLFSFSTATLLILTMLGKVSHGAESWFSFGFFSFQPSDFAKLALIIIMAKYFFRRHIQIANVKHILISGLYAFVFFALIIAHPDFGSAIILFLIWLGMVMISGISKKHLFAMLGIAILAFLLLWNFGFREYQKARIISFIDPTSDIHGTGYNAYQSMIAVGSGGLLGKGIGYGTQSRLKFLPEYETDFIFAAFAEEWGFVGVFIVLALFLVIIWRIVLNALHGATNFEILYGAGVAIFFIVHIIINVGMNLHLLPVTGTPMPFMSYGGTHILMEFTALGILMSMRRYSIPVHKSEIDNEFVGLK